jgi:hypothetical protein
MARTPIEKGDVHPVCVVLLWAVLLSAPLPLRAEALEREKAGVVKVTATVDGKRKTGTGFIVRLEQGTAYILTASHVVEGDNHPEIEFFTRRNVTSRAETARIEGDDPRGLALLLVRGKDNLPAGLVALPLASGASLSGGEEVTAIGFPQGGGPWAVVRANVVSRVGRDLTLGGSIDEGNSGGPILIDGNVAGVVMGVDGKFGRAIPAAIARLVLDGWGLPATSPDPGAGQSPPQGAEFRVVEVVPRPAQPNHFSGTCPVTIELAWKVSVKGTGKVSYSVIHADGASGPVESVSFSAPGSTEVRASWTLGEAAVARTYTSWAALRILEPQKIESEKSHFTVECKTASGTVPEEKSTVKIEQATCEKLRGGTTYRVVLRGQARGPAGGQLHASLVRAGKVVSTPTASCSGWKNCQRAQAESDSTAWTISTMHVGPPPDEAVLSVDPQSGATPPTPPAARAELRCYF